MKTTEKIKGMDITKGMTILVDKIVNDFCPFQNRKINKAITPKKNKKTECLDVLDVAISRSYNTGNGRAFTQHQIVLNTKQYGEVFIYSTNNFILA
jgi:hypothetical protein